MNRTLIALFLALTLAFTASAQTITPTGLNQGDLVALLQNIVNALGAGVGSTYLSVTGSITPVNQSGGMAIDAYLASATGPYVQMQKSRNATQGSHTIVQNNDQLGGVYFAGSNGTAFNTVASIVALVDGTPGATNDMPTRLQFYTTPDGSATSAVRAIINNAGNMTIGATDRASTTAKLYVDGLIRGNCAASGTNVNFQSAAQANDAVWFPANFQALNSAGALNDYGYIKMTIIDNTAGSQSGKFAVFVTDNNTSKESFTIDDSGEIYFPELGTTTATAANAVLEGSPVQLKISTSSRRYKKDIEPLVMDWNKFMTMNPVSFRPIEKSADSPKFHGFIAEDLEPIFPELVGMKDGRPESVHYGHITAINTEAIQDLKRENDLLKKDLADVMKRLEMLESR